MKTEFDEKSCGAVLYQRRNGQLRYLIARSSSGHISFSKGHMEEDETEWETAVREIREETGIARLRKTGDFRERFCCLTEKGKRKEIIYFLAEFEEERVIPQEDELTDIWILPFEDALEQINTEEEREILRRADKLLKAGDGHE